MEATTEKNIATFTHLSTLSQYVIPFGNYIIPIIIWTTNKDKSEFVDHHGKQTLNFQLSLLVYTLVLALIAIPIFIFTVIKNIPFQEWNRHHEFVWNDFSFGDNLGMITIGLIAVFLFCSMKVVEFFLIIYASIKASNGEKYNYPLTIPFIK
ncbi:DUF4870 domain-containing protein [Flavobacterium sp. 123]|uniref:DUF4870 domain-containing protein n=1 Tax=Flavobacterium sp. 123 TaxID=2135627 RepID=UPI000EB44F14|nr:DUF4870 domain-containing protein [Flavobacterium sp. 123]RKT00107.1 hypothetical protein C8C88_1923 [Flavobacterium sp. 123]